MLEVKDLEKKLAKGCSANDRRSQEQLYRRYFETMLGVVRRYTSDEEECLHILNAGFLRVFKKIDLFENKGSLEGWIRRIIFHAVADHFRSKKNNLRFMEIEERDNVTPPEQLEVFYEEDILKMVELLPDASRRVFQLYALEGYTHPEISESLGISVGTSKWHLSEARKRLKGIISKNEAIKKDAK